jgi:hypothetical protein
MARTNVALAVVGMLAAGCSDPTDGPSSRQFVAVGADGVVASSADGTTWTPRRSGVDVELASVATGASVFVAVGARGTIVTSTDGVAWSHRESETAADLRHVVFDGERFIAVGGSWEAGAVTLKSTDGRRWSAIDSPASHMFHAAAYGAGRLIAAAYYRSDLQTPALFRSGASSAGGWTEDQGPDFYDSINVDDDIVVVGGREVATSRDGTTWATTLLSGTALARAIATDGATLVIVGERGTIHRSVDRSSWQPLAAPTSAWLGGATAGDARFVAVGASGTVITSEDGATWTTAPTGVTGDLLDVTYGPMP